MLEMLGYFQQGRGAMINLFMDIVYWLLSLEINSCLEFVFKVKEGWCVAALVCIQMQGSESPLQQALLDVSLPGY